MRAKEYLVMTEAVNAGVRFGIRRAFKHVENAPEVTESQMDAIANEVMNSICEWFEFSDTNHE
jgi:hypothetical protein